jgi:TolB protein
LAKGREPRFSPNGKRIVFARRGPGGIQSIYTMSSTGTDVRRLTTAAALDNGPTWSPDGTQIVFARAKKKKGVWPPKPADLYTMNANGTNVRRLTRTPDHEDVPDWSPNGKRIAYATPAGIVTIKPNGQDKRFLGGGQPDWSPNGKRIAFNRDMQIWVMTASGKRKRALGPGSDLWANNPAWSPDGKQIAFVGFHPPGGSGEGTIGIFTMNADGTNAVQFTFGGKQGDFGLNDAFPDWQPR